MKYCSKCLYPETTRPSIEFDEKGVCGGCKSHIEQQKIDWVARENELLKLVKPFRKKSGYDCLIGVSGGKDSHFQTWYVTQVLKLRPLLVTFNHLDNSDTGLRNLGNLIEKFNVDHVRFTPSPEVVRKSCRWGIKKIGQPFWHEHAGIMNVPLQIASKYDIPLIIWGESGYNKLLGLEKNFLETRKTIMRNMEAIDYVIGNDEGLTVRDFQFATLPKDFKKIKHVYLGDYLKWNAIEHTKKMIEEYDFCTEKKERTFNIYENVECYYNDSVHDYIKYLKCGYGRATDHASQLIRLGYITREEGAWLVNRWDSKVSVRWFQFLDWIGMNIVEAMGHIDPHADSRVDFDKILPEKEPKHLPFIKNPYTGMGRRII